MTRTGLKIGNVGYSSALHNQSLGLCSRKRLYNAKAKIVGANGDRLSGAIAGSHIPREVVPASASHHSLVAVSSYPGAAILRRSRIGLIPTILTPFPNIAEHV